jgi:hypothetical protein
VTVLKAVGHMREEAVDLDEPAAVAPPAEAGRTDTCSCGARRTLLRHYLVTPCAGRALAKLKAAHPDEYDRYLTELRAEASAQAEAVWARHRAGDHS